MGQYVEHFGLIVLTFTSVVNVHRVFLAHLEGNIQAEVEVEYAELQAVVDGLTYESRCSIPSFRLGGVESTGVRLDSGTLS